MNKQQTAMTISNNLRLYRTQRGNYPPLLNSIVYNAHNHPSHELSKAVLGLKARIGLEVDISIAQQKAINHLAFLISEEIKLNKMLERKQKIKLLIPKDFVTEAIDIKTQKRIDFIILDDNRKIEIINTHINKALLRRYSLEGVQIIKI